MNLLPQCHLPFYSDNASKKTNTTFSQNNMDVLASVLNQAWSCCTFVFITFILSSMAAFISVFIYGENWVSVPE